MLKAALTILSSMMPRSKFQAETLAARRGELAGAGPIFSLALARALSPPNRRLESLGAFFFLRTFFLKLEAEFVPPMNGASPFGHIFQYLFLRGLGKARASGRHPPEKNSDQPCPSFNRSADRAVSHNLPHNSGFIRYQPPTPTNHPRHCFTSHDAFSVKLLGTALFPLP